MDSSATYEKPPCLRIFISMFHYAYNGQAVVDDCSQVIVAAEITQAQNDVNQLMPMITVAKENLERLGIDTAPRVILADAGYC